MNAFLGRPALPAFFLTRRAPLERVLPFALFIGVLAARSLLDSWLPSAEFPIERWLYALQIALPLAALFAFRRNLVELAEAPRAALPLLVSVLAGLAVFLLWIAPMPDWMHLVESSVPFSPLDADGNPRWDLVALRCTGAVLIVPVMEELFWRSFLLRWIDRRDFRGLIPARGTPFALFLSSAVFALAHELWFAAFLAGLVYALIYRRFGNLWYAVIAHATTNLALAVWVLDQRLWTYW